MFVRVAAPADQHELSRHSSPTYRPRVSRRQVRALGGTLAPQFPVTRADSTGLLDDITGPGAVLLLHTSGPDDDLAQHQRFELNALGVQVLTVGAQAPADLHDVTGAWGDWFTTNALQAVLIRPDHYIFGGVTDRSDLPQLTHQYRQRLCVAASSVTKATSASPA